MPVRTVSEADWDSERYQYKMKSSMNQLWHAPSHTRCVHQAILAAAPRPIALSLKGVTCSSITATHGVRQLTIARAMPADVENDEEQQIRVLSEVTRRIKEHGQRGRVKAAIEELAGLAKLGLQPDLPAATALVRACCKDMELAQNIFDELFGELLEPDEVAFAVLLRGYGAKNPPDWVRMDTVLSTMRGKYDMEPSAISYNALLEVCARTNDLERGENVIDRMESDGVEPDEFTEGCVSSRRSLRSYLRKKLL